MTDSSPPPSSANGGIVSIASSAPVPQTLAPLSVRLNRNNYIYWKAQVMPMMRAYDLDGFILGTKLIPPVAPDPQSSDPDATNFTRQKWIRVDQFIMSWLLTLISESMLGDVVRCSSSSEIWKTLEQLSVIQSRARVLQLRNQLQSMKKGSLSIDEYMLKMKNIAESLLADGQSITDEELILYVLGGLGQEYEYVVINLTSQTSSLSLSEVQFMLQNQEMRVVQQNNQ